MTETKFTTVSGNSGDWASVTGDYAEIASTLDARTVTVGALDTVYTDQSGRVWVRDWEDGRFWGSERAARENALPGDL